mgnify:CR=1 FL=1
MRRAPRLCQADRMHARTPRQPPRWYVISLRPSAAHDGLRRAAQALGARAGPVDRLVGEHVNAGQLLAQARLLHQTLDITAPHAGVVEQIVVGHGEPIGHGAVLAHLVPI